MRNFENNTKNDAGENEGILFIADILIPAEFAFQKLYITY
jgi:hypothetical protein